MKRRQFLSMDRYLNSERHYKVLIALRLTRPACLPARMRLSVDYSRLVGLNDINPATLLLALPQGQTASASNGLLYSP